MRENRNFELGGVNHVALVCRDMARTVGFFTQVLGMPLAKTLNLPEGGGQHFFFDIGNGDHLAFFWFPGAHEAAPGIASPAALPGGGDIATAHGSMNHLAFNVPLERFEEYRQALLDRGRRSAPSSTTTTACPRWPASSTPACSSVRATRDPDGVLLEFAAWCRELSGEGDVVHDPVDADGAPRRWARPTPAWPRSDPRAGPAPVVMFRARFEARALGCLLKGASMHFGLRYCNAGSYSRPEVAVPMAQLADGWASSRSGPWSHVVVPHGYESRCPYCPNRQDPRRRGHPIASPTR